MAWVHQWRNSSWWASGRRNSQCYRWKLRHHWWGKLDGYSRSRLHDRTKEHVSYLEWNNCAFTNSCSYNYRGGLLCSL